MKYKTTSYTIYGYLGNKIWGSIVLSKGNMEEYDDRFYEIETGQIRLDIIF